MNIKLRVLLVLLLVLGIATATTDCATGHVATPIGSGIEVHTFRRAWANAHLVAHGGDFVLVDSGLEENGPALADDLRGRGFAPEHLRAIVLTHGHADHAGGASWFKRTFGTRVVVGAGDVPLLAAGQNDHLCPTNDSARSRLDDDQAARYAGFAADVTVAARTPLASATGVDGLPGEIVPMPGHTPGSLVVVLPDAAIVGDLFRGAILGSSAEVHFYMCDLAGNRSDVRTLLTDVAPNARVFFTGHFGPVARAAVEERFP